MKELSPAADAAIREALIRSRDLAEEAVFEDQDELIKKINLAIDALDFTNLVFPPTPEHDPDCLVTLLPGPPWLVRDRTGITLGPKETVDLINQLWRELRAALRGHEPPPEPVPGSWVIRWGWYWLQAQHGHGDLGHGWTQNPAAALRFPAEAEAEAYRLRHFAHYPAEVQRVGSKMEHTAPPPDDNWLERQVKIAAETVASWPEWKRKAYEDEMRRTS